ncbi:MAG: tetratricopeptide repeat protein [Deltaproteobacteria bacterium]
MATEAHGIKLLLSARPELGLDPRSTRERHDLWWSTDARSADGRAARSVRLAPLAWSEAVDIWARMAAARGLKPWFTPEQLRQRYRLIERSLTSPLGVRLHLEAFDGRPLPKQFAYGDTVCLRVERAAEQAGDGGRLLRAIARRSLAAPRGDLALDELMEDPEIGSDVRSRDIRAPYRRLLHHRLLVERATERGTVVAAGLPLLVSHAAGDALVEEGSADTPEALANVRKRFESSALAGEAVRRALQLRVGRDGLGFLCRFVDATGTPARNPAGVVLASWLRNGGDPAVAGHQLTENLTDADLVVMASAAEDLRLMREPVVAATLLEVAANHPGLARCGPRARAELHVERSLCAHQAGRPGDAVTARYAELAANLEEGDLDEVNRTRLWLAQELLDFGNVDEARSQAETALLAFRMAEREDDAIVAENLLGLVAFGKRQWDEAASRFRRVHDDDLRRHGPESLDIAASLNNIGLVEYQTGRLAEAHDAFQRVLEIRRTHLVPDDPLIAQTHNNLALIQLGAGDPEAARHSLRLALRVLTEALGPDHPDLALTLMNLAGAEQTLGQIEEATRLLRQAVDLTSPRAGETVSLHARCLMQLAESEVTAGHRDGIEVLFERARASIALVPDPHAEALIAHTEGFLCESDGDFESAERHFRRACARAEDALPDGHLFRWIVRAALGRSLVALGRSDEGERELAIALAGFERGGSTRISLARLAVWTLAQARWDRRDSDGLVALLDGPLADATFIAGVAREESVLALRIAAASARGEALGEWQRRVDALEARWEAGDADATRRGVAWSLELTCLAGVDASAALERHERIVEQLAKVSHEPAGERVAWALGVALQDGGHVERSIPVLEACLALEVSLGFEPAQTFETRVKLCDALEHVGRLVEALPVGEAALSDLRAFADGDESVRLVEAEVVRLRDAVKALEA